MAAQAFLHLNKLLSAAGSKQSAKAARFGWLAANSLLSQDQSEKDGPGGRERRILYRF